MSKISNDKLEKPKALSIMAVLIIGNLISMLKFISFLIFDGKPFYIIGENKTYWLSIALIILGILYMIYGREKKLNEIIEYYSSNARYNTFLSKSITITYILVTLKLVLIST